VKNIIIKYEIAVVKNLCHPIIKAIPKTISSTIMNIENSKLYGSKNLRYNTSKYSPILIPVPTGSIAFTNPEKMKIDPNQFFTKFTKISISPFGLTIKKSIPVRINPAMPVYKNMSKNVIRFEFYRCKNTN
jgi:hypothetical protein